jgi:hypothetical protein
MTKITEALAPIGASATLYTMAVEALRAHAIDVQEGAAGSFTSS